MIRPQKKLMTGARLLNRLLTEQTEQKLSDEEESTPAPRHTPGPPGRRGASLPANPREVSL
jgi:hypothetical protein